jgi:hypothetical protein
VASVKSKSDASDVELPNLLRQRGINLKASKTIKQRRRGSDASFGRNKAQPRLRQGQGAKIVVSI